MMCKERTFYKTIKVNNFRIIDRSLFNDVQSLTEGDSFSEEVILLAEVFYTPKGYRGVLHEDFPLAIWDADHAKRLYGITKDKPEGDLEEKNFDTSLAAMHFLTRRLKKLGWEPLDSWHKP